MRRRVWAASLLLVAGCSGGSSTAITSTTPTTTSATTAAARTTSAATSTSAARSTTSAARSTTSATRSTTTTAATTTSGAASSTSTTNVPAAPCDAAALLAAAQQAFGPLPEGSTATDPRCVENYATAVLTAPGQDNALAVFNNPEGEWIGRNLGTDQVCSGAGVPPDFFGPLGCGPWEG
jgi:hypothetical protein